MAVFSGTAILNTGGTAADQPATNPLLTVPAGGSAIVGFAFTNPTSTQIIVQVYRNSIALANLLFAAVTVPALSGMLGGPAVVTQACSLTLNAGETIFAQSSNLGGWVNVEIDGYPLTAAIPLVANQMSLGLMLMLHEAFGIDIPDAATMNTGFTF
jgi:hypothetical protein